MRYRSKGKSLWHVNMARNKFEARSAFGGPVLRRSGQSRGRFLVSVWLLLSSAAWIVLAPSLEGQQIATPDEYRTEANFVFSFFKFVEWPGDAFSDRKAPLVIGILGYDPFDTYLRQVVAGKTVQDRAIEIRVFHKGDDLRACHILYVSPSERKQWPQILEKLRGASVMTVADMPSFLEAGGIVEFGIEERQTKIKINIVAAEAARLQISSKLLAIAHVAAASQQQVAH